MAIDIFNPVGAALTNIDRANRLSDYLTNYRFHVIDVSFSNPQVFSLSYGFRFVSAPEMQVDVKEFKEGNFEYPRKVITGAKVSDITMHRGVKFFDSDFYDWIRTATRGTAGTDVIRGNTPLGDFRKNLLLIQYSDIATGIGDGGSFSGLSFSSLVDLVRLVPARAWMLYDCIPINYKSGTDFDAIGADVSIAELTVSPRFIEEYNSGI